MKKLGITVSAAVIISLGVYGYHVWENHERILRNESLGVDLDYDPRACGPEGSLKVQLSNRGTRPILMTKLVIRFDRKGYSGPVGFRHIGSNKIIMPGESVQGCYSAASTSAHGTPDPYKTFEPSQIVASVVEEEKVVVHEFK